ncbi:glycerophosphodiester phosphodiesterase [Mesorhizobium loti]|nr:glycerophosphodiester phosphodiesterase [Mesorhizobium loti]
MSQQFDRTNLRNDTCTASRMLPPTHGYLENTIPSMRASFEAGADIVELDVHPTTDGKFAVFHDWTLDCRTNGHGVTREHSMAEMRELDVGYGYTADAGKTFPFRGKGVGMMPSLDEVLATFPRKRFLINIKSNDASEGDLLSQELSRIASGDLARLMVYGGDKPIAALRRALPDIKTMSLSSLKGCLIPYIAYGWTGVVPAACNNMVIFVPTNFAGWLWGWPNVFLNRMASANSLAFLVGPYHGGEFSTGIDTRDQVLALPGHYSGGVLTNELEVVGPELRTRLQSAR